MVFLDSTGATGYIGGEVLHRLANSLLATEITALVRNQASAALITTRYPSVSPLIADLDSAKSIEKAASHADVVLREFCIHIPWEYFADRAFFRFG